MPLNVPGFFSAVCVAFKILPEMVDVKTIPELMAICDDIPEDGCLGNYRFDNKEYYFNYSERSHTIDCSLNKRKKLLIISTQVHTQYDTNEIYFNYRWDLPKGTLRKEERDDLKGCDGAKFSDEKFAKILKLCPSLPWPTIKLKTIEELFSEV